jgi:hypothetical protein
MARWSLRRRSLPSGPEAVEDDNFELTPESLRKIGPEGVREILWADLIAVDIQVSGTSAPGDDVWFVLSAKDGSYMIVPMAAEQSPAVARAVSELPGYDHLKAIDAMSCTETRTFAVWRSSAPTSTPN